MNDTAITLTINSVDLRQTSWLITSCAVKGIRGLHRRHRGYLIKSIEPEPLAGGLRSHIGTTHTARSKHVDNVKASSREISWWLRHARDEARYVLTPQLTNTKHVL